MGIYHNIPYILILLSIPFQYNLMSDSVDPILSDKQKDWKTKKELSYYETYFVRKLSYYTSMVSSIAFIFVYYKYRKMRLIISINYFLLAITWLLYFAVNEKTLIVLYILRCLQGIFIGALQISHFTYVMLFANIRKKCFYGCLTQFSMFLGLFFMNFLFTLFSWKTVVIILFVESSVFGGLIWMVPEIHIKPKSVTKESVFSKENFKKLLIAMTLMLLQLLSGIGILLNDLSKMLNGIGVNLIDTLESCLFDFVAALATLITSFIIDVVGSKLMWCLSFFGLCVGLIIYAVTLKIDMGKWVGTLGVFIYFLFYGLGSGPIPWYIGSTLFPDSVRIESTAICTFWNLFIPQILDMVWINLNKSFERFGSIIFCSIASVFGLIFGIIFIPVDQDDSYEDNKNIF